MAKHPDDNRQDINAERKKLQNILREPLTQRRLFLAAKLNAAKNPANEKPFTFEEFEQFIRAIPDTHDMMAKEVGKVLEVVKTGKTMENPDLTNPSSQLLWGATLAWLTLNPAVVQGWNAPSDETGGKPKPATPVTKTAIWKQLTQNKVSAEEKLTHGRQIRETLRSKNTKYDWSPPGAGTRYDRDKDIIYFDLMQNLISGFEHARADIHRQIGFALIVTSYTPRMAEVAREMSPLMRKAQKAAAKKGPQLKQDEYKKLRLLSTEWQLRHMLFMAAEGNPVNRYASDLSYQFKFMQDIGVSVNNSAVTTRGIGLVSPTMGNDDMSDEVKRYMNLCHAVELSFFQNNKLFEDTDAAWRQAGVLPELVRTNETLKKSPGDKRGIDHPDFKYLRELCGGKDGLEHQQVEGYERMFGNFFGRVAARDAKRKEIIAEIEEKFTEQLLQKILEQANDDVQKELDQGQQNNQQQQDGDGQEQEGEDGQDGQEGQGQGQGKGKGKGKGKAQKGQQGQGQAGGEGDDSGDSGDASSGGEPGQGQSKDQESGNDDPADGKGKQDKNKQEDGKKGKGAGDIGKDEDQNIPVEGAGDMPGVEKASETPEDEGKPAKDADGNDSDGKGKDGEGEDSDGQDGDSDDSQTLEEMMKEQAERAAQEQAQQDADADAEEADGQSQDGQKGGGKGKKPGGKKAGHGGGRSLGDLAKEDWTKYDQRIAELREPIGRARKLFKEVQKRQLQPKKAVSRQLEILPENGEVMERFNIEAHRNLIIKKATRDVEEHDLRRFQADEKIMVPTEVDIVILIDGSGSMVPSPLDSALQAGAILFEAANAKDMKMNVYVGLWGSEDPPILIRPGDTPTKIGQTMQAYRKGLNSGTDLAPAIRNTAQVIGEQRGRAGTLSGFTHILVISDGDIGDAEEAIKVIDTMFTYSDKTTVDTAVISQRHGDTSMEEMAKNASKKMAKKDYHVVGTAREIDANRVPDSILGLLLEKIRKCGSFNAVPNTEKRRAMRKAHDKMKEGKRRP